MVVLVKGPVKEDHAVTVSPTRKRILDLQTLKGVHLRSAATVLAWATSQAGQSETPTYRIFRRDPHLRKRWTLKMT